MAARGACKPARFLHYVQDLGHKPEDMWSAPQGKTTCVATGVSAYFHPMCRACRRQLKESAWELYEKFRETEWWSEDEAVQPKSSNLVNSSSSNSSSSQSAPPSQQQQQKEKHMFLQQKLKQKQQQEQPMPKTPLMHANWMLKPIPKVAKRAPPEGWPEQVQPQQQEQQQQQQQQPKPTALISMKVKLGDKVLITDPNGVNWWGTFQGIVSLEGYNAMHVEDLTPGVTLRSRSQATPRSPRRRTTSEAKRSKA